MSNWREVLSRVKDHPRRQYTISGDDDQLDELERVFDFITYCCSVGHSTGISIDVDGDGAANLRIERVGGKLIHLDDTRVKQDEQGKQLHFGFGD